MIVHHANIGFKWWRIGFSADLIFNPNYLSLGTGAVLNPQGDHPHLVGNISFVFVHLTIGITFCAHSLKEHS